MMGTHQPQKDLFSYGVDLDRRVRQDHPLRAVARNVDFSFVREEVKGKYGRNGNVGLDPEVVLKLMFLLFWDNVKSERELMKVLSERLDYLWFLGYGLDDDIPNHSVLSKARNRWGGEVFESLFVRSVSQCVEAGLVGGDLLHMDGSLIDANASRDSVLKSDPEMISHLREAYGVQEAKLEKPAPKRPRRSAAEQPGEEGATGGEKKGRKAIGHSPVNRELISLSDPDTASVRKKTGGESRPRYKAHRAVDDERGVIVATETTSGDVEENARMKPLIEQSESNTGDRHSKVVADSQYGTAENFRDATAMGIETHMKPYGGRPSKLYGPEKFAYDAGSDTYVCPRGERLYPRSPDKIRMGIEYVVRKGTCAGCPLRSECTNAKTGRTVLRRWGQELIDEGTAAAATMEAKRSRDRRKWLMEGSFAQSANHHGFKKSRWRRIWRQRIQDHMICTIQNVKILLTSGWKSRSEAAKACSIVRVGPSFANWLLLGAIGRLDVRPSPIS